MKTPVNNQQIKLDIIEHINQDHIEEIQLIIMNKSHELSLKKCLLKDIFEEGIDILINTSDNKEITLFVPFDIRGTIKEKLQFLFHEAVSKTNKVLKSNQHNYFKIIEKSLLTKNILRLTVKSELQLPVNKPGYSYRFLLKKYRSKNYLELYKTISQPTFNYLNSLALWCMKKLPNKAREKLFKLFTPKARTYTLQKSFKSNDEFGFYMGFIDIFLHENSPGSKWAIKVKPNDIIESKGEFEEKFVDFNVGKILLIADETAYPALLGILESWQNPLKPEVLIISSERDNQHYFDNSICERFNIQNIVCSPENQAEVAIKYIDKVPSFDGVWGAFEHHSAQKVKYHIRNKYKLIGKLNQIKGYWILK